MPTEMPHQTPDIPPNEPSLDGTLSLTTERRINAVCLAFEDACRSESAPRLEDYLGTASGVERTALLRELLRLDLDYRRCGGQQPTAEEYLPRFPGDGPIVAAVFAAISNEPPLQFPVDIPAGAKLGRYVVERLLGQGSFGKVYLARDEQLERRVAIKVPRRKQSASPEELHHYLEEARTVAQLQHSGIAAVFDAGGTDDGIPYIVSQYIEGNSLKKSLKEKPPTPSEAAELLAQVAAAVQFAHRQGFVHRDLKPSNILIDLQGKPYVVDFGLALHESVQQKKTGELSGTLPYMAPEQVRCESHRLDGRADIWALGVILYEAVTGRRPFDAADADLLEEEILHREPKPPRQINDRVPPELERICLKCLAKDVTQRYSSAADLARDLQRFLRPERNFSRRTYLSFLALAICGLGVWAFWPAAPSPLPTLEGTLDLFIWNPDDSARWSLSLKDPAALPLRPNDQIRIHATLNRPAYLYLIWIDSQGKAAPIYPWTPGHWEQRPEKEKPSDRLSLPTAEGRGWKMEGPSGMETLMLLARDEPLPREVDVKEQFAQLPPTNLPNPRALVCFVQGRPVTAAMDAQRGPNFFDTEQINDPVLVTQRLIQERLNQYFPLIRAVSLASVGEEK